MPRGNPDLTLQDEALIAQAQAMLTNQSNWSTPKKPLTGKRMCWYRRFNPAPIDLVMNPPLEVKQDYGFFTLLVNPLLSSFVFSATRTVACAALRRGAATRVHLSSIAEGFTPSTLMSRLALIKLLLPWLLKRKG